jgi:hypothetical protein
MKREKKYSGYNATYCAKYGANPSTRAQGVTDICVTAWGNVDRLCYVWCDANMLNASLHRAP